ncbi:hypothetical protein [Micromonospora endolithica]|uniref:FXSXX-COOH protein n=1 Tax=Micromonospora endolithica TaxID=230091 RepID=A0A3A9ZGU6_9ACTN|nr:hypothetical protein [Micromonospora endolithica]RKN47530.1 hypothetical protein D7223_12155 [Micromonospora endolithica]TWJ21170.1 hypothetical protein JD76_01280 [Micromonospora endolithica]
MDMPSTEIEVELLDLSTVDVATLRSVPATDLETTIRRVNARITDAEGSISGYSGSFSGRMRPENEPEPD